MRLGEGCFLGVGPAVEAGAMETGATEEKAEEEEGCSGWPARSRRDLRWTRHGMGTSSGAGGALGEEGRRSGTSAEVEVGARGPVAEDAAEGGLGAGAPMGSEDTLPIDDKTGLAKRLRSLMVGNFLRAIVGGRGAKVGGAGPVVVSEGGGANAGGVGVRT